jgi:hypothetical protein
MRKRNETMKMKNQMRHKEMNKEMAQGTCKETVPNVGEKRKDKGKGPTTSMCKKMKSHIKNQLSTL